MRPQAERVMDYMKNNGSITSLQAIDDLGITRLSAVIFDIKAAGWDIKDRFIKVGNRYGEDCRVKQYWCIGKKRTWLETFISKVKEYKMFKWIKKLFHKEQPVCEYAHIVYVLQEIQKANEKTKKKAKQNVKNKTKKSK